MATESWIDSSKLAIWGWSYGGYTTLKALTLPDQPFACGVAVAPVTDWHFYDTAYTERFMGRLAVNTVRYSMSDVLASKEATDNLVNGPKLMLVHGLADDNVHWQQSAILVNRLAALGAPNFSFMTHPLEHHGLIHVRRQLYTSLARFIVNDCFGGSGPNAPADMIDAPDGVVPRLADGADDE